MDDGRWDIERRDEGMGNGRWEKSMGAMSMSMSVRVRVRVRETGNGERGTGVISMPRERGFVGTRGQGSKEKRFIIKGKGRGGGGVKRYGAAFKHV